MESDKQRLQQWVKDHHHALVALARVLLGDDAEEAVQNAWLKAYRAMESFEGRSQVRTWLGRIVLNEAKMLLRARRREILVGNPGDDDAYEAIIAKRYTGNGGWRHPPGHWHDDSPEALLTRDDLAECLETLLDSMPKAQRALLELRDATGLGFTEICNELEVSASNARVLLHRARTRLYNLVDHYEETGEC